MIFGLGVDIVEVERMRVALERHPRMKERLFSKQEREYCESSSRPEVHYALRFAAKEAVLKAIGTGFEGMRFTDVEVARDQKGKPYPVLHGRAAQVAEELDVSEMHLSLSYTHSTAVASAVAIQRREREPVPETPSEKRARLFKEARAIVDEEPAPRQGDDVTDGSG